MENAFSCLIIKYIIYFCDIIAFNFIYNYERKRRENATTVCHSLPTAARPAVLPLERTAQCSIQLLAPSNKWLHLSVATDAVQ